MKNFKILTISVLLVVAANLSAQIKISDSGSSAPDANSILELESSTRGFLPPRVAIDSLTGVSPLTGTVPTGMLVYSTGGGVTDGYYLWDGSKWQPFSTGQGGVNVVAKTANATLTKDETFVVASNNITLTLPSITSADDGLSITIKNIGTHTHQVAVVGSSATIDGKDTSKLYRWKARTFIAYNSNWLLKDKETEAENIFDVGPSQSWTTIPEVLEFLATHMLASSVVRLDGGTYNISATQVIDLPFPLTIEGPSYGQDTIAAATGLDGLPMFRCLSDVSFKMIAFTATSLSGYGNDAGEDAIQLETSGAYHEIKDCTFDSFNSAIVLENNVDVWLFESDISNSVVSGVEIAAGTSKYVSFYTSESDFSDCAVAIDLVSGDSAYLSVQNCTFTCGDGQMGLGYNPTNFTNTVTLFFTNNTWNNLGTFIDINASTGFDFTRSDGRDANVEIVNNAGIGDKNPHCVISVVNNASTTTITTAGTYYKCNWTNTSSTTVNWGINDNQVTYLPTNSKDVVFHISGNVSVSQNNRNVTIGIVKGGDTGTRYGETTLRLTTANQPFQFSTVIYLQNVAKDNYFELYSTSSSNSDVLTFQDVNIYITSE